MLLLVQWVALVLLLVFGAESVLDLQVTLADIVTSTVSIHKNKLRDKRVCHECHAVIKESKGCNAKNDVAGFDTENRIMHLLLLWLCFLAKC